MFDERPYRSQSRSFWSIWWVVGVMAFGLTAWHLEMLPLPALPVSLTGATAPVSDQEETELLPLADNQFDNEFQETVKTALAEYQPRTANEPFPPAQMEPEQTALPTMISTGLTQLRYEQPLPPAQKGSAEGYQYNQHPEQILQAHDLLYRPHDNPVPVQQLPNHQGGVPIQTASFEQSQTEPEFASSLPVNTAAAARQVNEPAVNNAVYQQHQTAQQFVLSSQAEQDLLKLRTLSETYWQNEAERSTISDELQLLAHQVFFQPDEHFLPGHTVQPGEQLRLIARQYDIPWEYLARLNRVEPEKVRAGQTLKVIQGPFSSVVDLSDRRLTIHANGYYVASFPVAIGQNDATPTGEFQVLNKVINPTWYGPNGMVPGNDPHNPLGEHWLDLGNGIGIHGTIEPHTIGEAVSNGCVRMRADDVALVHDLLINGSQVIIRP